MQESALILTLTGSLAAALTLGYVTQRLRLSPIIGYPLAGLIVGPYSPGFVADRAVANEFAEIGIVLLMFGVGLQFHVKDLLAVRKIAIVGALAQSAVTTVLGTLAGLAFKWPWSSSVLFGLALSVASTVMLTRVLVDTKDLQTPAGRIAIGWLVMEDVFTVVVSVLLPAIFLPSSGHGLSLTALVAVTIGKLGVLAILAFVLGGRVIPRILNSVAVTHSRELFTLAVLVIALGIAVGSAKAFGGTLALGAFLAGVIVGRSEFSFRAASDALPMRDAFAVLFFVSVGMLLDPRALMKSPHWLLSTLAIILLAKPIAAFLITALLGYSPQIGIRIAVALAQIGEFSLVLATVGNRLNILPQGVTNLIIAASIISLSLNPVFYRSIGRLDAMMARFSRIGRRVDAKAGGDAVTEDARTESTYRAVVVGYGPIGQTVARLLQEGGVEPVIIDVNLEATRRIRSAGRRVVYGDATRPEVIEAAGIRNAIALIVSGPTPEQTSEIIRIARTLNPNARVISRAYYLRETASIRASGADEVFSGEGEVALAMTGYILGTLGATPEQIDRVPMPLRFKEGWLRLNKKFLFLSSADGVVSKCRVASLYARVALPILKLQTTPSAPTRNGTFL